MQILAIIPARSGSKSVRNKNIRLLNGKPLLAYSVEHALASRYIDRVIVDTDSEDYAGIAREYGAEVPYIRPAKLAEDTSLDYEVFYHALTCLRDREGYVPEMIVQLRPTYPIRDVKDIDNMIEMLERNDNADSVRCVVPAKEIAYKMWRVQDDGRMTPLLTDIPEAYNMPRQVLPAIYYQNACIDVIRSSTILEKHSMSGEYILGYIMDHFFDIDTEEELIKCEKYLKLLNSKKKYVFDIDGVIAKYREDLDYASALPDKRMIQIINRLYDAGNDIVLFTARGYKTGINWEEITRRQLAAWGLRYHELKFGKPDADYYIDDKMLDIKELLELFEPREKGVWK